MEINEGNGIIAEFRGYTKTKYGYNKRSSYRDSDGHLHETSATHKNLNYHENWNLLMPVVEAIKNHQAMNTKFLYDLLINYTIEKVWKECIGFIQWWNDSQENKNKK